MSKLSSNKIIYVSPDLYLNGSVAIVGSSGNLLSAKHGSQIDTYDNVIRVNRAEVSKKYSEQVGMKTTLRVVNNLVFDNADISNQGYTNSPKKFVKKLRNTDILFVGPDDRPWSRRKKNTHKSNNLFKFDYSNIDILKKNIGIKSERNLQVGTVLVALCILSEFTPHLFGFDLENVKRTHYFEQRPPEEDYVNHSPDEEKKALRELAENKAIKVY